MDPRCLDAMLPLLTHKYGNPHSRTHSYGWEAESQIEDARKVCVCVVHGESQGVSGGLVWHHPL